MNNPTRDMSDEEYQAYAMMRASRDTLARELDAVREALSVQQKLTRKLTEDAQAVEREHREELDLYIQQASEFSSLAVRRARQLIAVCDAADRYLHVVGYRSPDSGESSNTLIACGEVLALAKVVKLARSSVQ